MEKGKFEKIKIKQLKRDLNENQNTNQNQEENLKENVKENVKEIVNENEEEDFVVKDFSMGWGFFIFLTKEGLVFSQGWNKNGFFF